MVQNYKFLENFETFLIWKSDFLVFFNEIEIFSDFFWSWGMYTLNLMHASLTTDEPFNGEDNWYFSFKNCTTLIPEIRMNKLLLCQIAVIILISSLQGEWTGLYYSPNTKFWILPNSFPKLLKILFLKILKSKNYDDILNWKIPNKMTVVSLRIRCPNYE